jgi:hypothetical protein
MMPIFIGFACAKAGGITAAAVMANRNERRFIAGISFARGYHS